MLVKIFHKGQIMPEVKMSDESFDRILRIKSVLDRTGLTRSTLYRKMQHGTFPRQVSISQRCAGWRESAVNAWLQDPTFYDNRDSSRP